MDQNSWDGLSRQSQQNMYNQQVRFQSNSHSSHQPNFENGGTGLWGNPLASSAHSGANWTSGNQGGHMGNNDRRIPRNVFPQNAYPGGFNNSKNGQNVKGKFPQNLQQKEKGNPGWRVSNNIPNANSPNNDLANASETSGEMSPTAEPQYRIFKRGDSLPGISSLNITQVNEVSLQKDESPHREAAPNCSNNPPVSENPEPSSSTFAFDNKNPTTRVSELAKYHSVRAEYRLTKEAGPPHAPIFTVNLFLGTEEYEGQGTSIKRAQQAAATLALKNTSFTKPPVRSQTKYNPRIKGQIKAPPTAVLSKLAILAEELQEKLTFTSQPVTISDPFLRVNPTSIVNVHFGSMMFTGEGPNYHMAKTSAAITALKALIQLKKEKETEQANGVGTENAGDDDSVKSPISLVHEMSLKRNLNVTFVIVGEEGPPHMKVFSLECRVGEFVCKGEGSTKQLAKKYASEAMIEKLKEIPIPSLDDANATFKLIQKSLNPNFKSKQSRKKKCPVVKDIEKQVVSPVSRLIQIAHVKKYKEPEYVVISKLEPPVVETKNKGRMKKIKPHFTIQVTVGPHVCQGSGSNKKDAKKAAADAALVVMGYAPSLPQIIKPLNKTSDEPTNGVKPSGKVSKGRENQTSVPSKTNPISEKGDAPNVTARQIVPGVLVLKSEPQQNQSTGGESSDNKVTDLPGVMQKMLSTNCRFLLPDQTIENKKKLVILANLFNLQVAYSDFPKKNEFLSVVTLSTNPPQVAHGVGATLEEAQNLAALKILEECALLDSWTPNAE